MSITSRIRFPFYLSLTLLTGWSAQAQADTVITVGVASHGGAVILGGSVIPLKEVTLAAQMPGRIISIAGEEGDEFAAGTLLVKINDDDLMAKKAAAEAQLATAQNSVQNAQVQYNRELWNPRVYNPRPMAGMGMPSMFDGFFDNETMVASARSMVTTAESGLRELNAKLRDTKAVAPFEGVIMKKMVEIGDTVQPGQPLIIFSYSKFLRIRAEVPARLMPGLKKGMVVPARLDVGNTLVNARVAQISPVADKRQHTVTVKFDLPEGVPGGPGMYAEVMIPDVSSPSRALAVVPLAAIQKKGSLPSVQVLDEENKPKMRLVRIGEVVDEDSVTILSGLKPGERILVRDRN